MVYDIYPFSDMDLFIRYVFVITVDFIIVTVAHVPCLPIRFMITMDACQLYMYLKVC